MDASLDDERFFVAHSHFSTHPLGPYVSATSIHIFIIRAKKVHLVVLEIFFPCFLFTRKCKDVMQFLGWMLGAPKTHDIDLLERKDNHGEFQPWFFFFFLGG